GGLDQTCFLIRTDSVNILLDCGCSALISLNKAGISPSIIDVLVVSHFHGDHFGGVPFLIRQQHFEKREKPLTLIGPASLDKYVISLESALFPSSTPFTPCFEIRIMEFAGNSSCCLNDNITIEAFEVDHVPETLPHAIRLTCFGKIIAYSGDTRWTPKLIEVSKNADLFICETYTLNSPNRIHMHYDALVENEHLLTAKEIILTHCSEEVLKADHLKYRRADEVKKITL
ncbi:MAG: MBL fold metallo-hydrolase, partial [Flavisolibacter sp.]|nr:MBL fold metallo-hydrolase [Flavisolibacter sp.]